MSMSILVDIFMCVPRDIMQIDRRNLRLIRNLYWMQRAAVRVADVETE